MKSQRERADERRAELLADIQRQVDGGRLTIRKMTAEERARHPAPVAPAARGRRRPRV